MDGVLSCQCHVNVTSMSRQCHVNVTQAAAGLTVDGVVGPLTKAKIVAPQFDAIRHVQEEAAAAPAAAPYKRGETVSWYLRDHPGYLKQPALVAAGLGVRDVLALDAAGARALGLSEEDARKVDEALPAKDDGVYGHTVVHSNWEYFTLPQGNPTHTKKEQDQDQHQIPAGACIVSTHWPDFEAIRKNVIMKYPWQTHVVHCRKGSDQSNIPVAYCTKGFKTPGQIYASPFVTLTQNTIQLTATCGRVLLRRPMVHQ